MGKIKVLSLIISCLLGSPFWAQVALAQIAGSGLGGRFCPSKATVNQTASATVITGSSSNRIYICAVVLVSAAAQNISIVEGTGTNCATGIAAVIGGTTASIAVAQEGGFSSIAPFAWINTATAANNLCVLQSGTGNISGVITYRSAP